MNSSIAFFLILVAFGVGYWLVSLFFNRFNLPKFGEGNEGVKNNENDSEKSQRFEENQAGQSELRHSNHVIYYSELLELKGDLSVENIKKKYREQQAKYHPDKVSHLGAEFQQIAERKTREINNAYDFFKQQHGFN